jgi:lysophospholipase L1-like esterase
MNLRRAGLVMVVVATLVGAACAPQPTGPDAINSVRPYCPFDDKLVIYGGDSLVTKWPAYITLPSDLVPYNTAKGGSLMSRDVHPEGGFGTVGSRVLAELDQCGNDIGVAVFGGGAIDISIGLSTAEITAAFTALDEQLYARGVPAVFLTITPVSNNTEWFPAHQTQRQAINAWMKTPGNLHGTVVDCASAIESAPGSDILAPQYVNITDFFGTIDLLHPNEAGFAAIAACIQPTVIATAEGH